MAKDYYSILGVSKSATKDDIKKAFRKLAHEYHPDKKGGSADKFKEISEAYSILSDDSKRSQYDTFGSGFNGNAQGGGFNPNDFAGFDFSQYANGQAGGFEFDLGDIFGDIFGGARGGGRGAKGRDISVDVDLSFEDSVFGVEKEININRTTACKTCKGNGAKPGSSMETCSVCNGKGKIREMRRSIIGSFSSVRTCETCSGTGQIPKEKCDTCAGKGTEKREEKIPISIPAGIEDGEILRLGGQGEALRGAVTGDLYIKVHVEKHSLYIKDGYNLRTSLSVKLSDVLLGADKHLKTLDGDITLKIPEGTQHGDVLRIRGKGVPYAANKRGDILVQILIEMPKKLSKDARKQIEALKKREFNFLLGHQASTSR